ncbi:MAG: GHKL domain-containing protein [Clostridia bacterium]|nr:GHKL domain-containing protein [Clostridia bacterium]
MCWYSVFCHICLQEEMPMNEHNEKGRRILPALLPVLFAVLIFSVLLTFLYRTDNKYTQKELQPIAGLLWLDADTLAAQPVYYLTHGWEFYPDVLLTPSAFSNGKQPDTYMQYVTIGQHQTFSFVNADHPNAGVATYHLTMELPETPSVYTFMLPEVYSAYDLYINDQKMLSLGDPARESFSEKIGRRSITFSASGTTSFVIAVANRSHFSSGLIFPPAFGIPEAITRTESVHFLFGVIRFILAILCTLLSFYLIFAFRRKNSNHRVLLFFASSLCISITWLYPILFTYIEISPLWWYGVELLAIYGGYLFTVMLHNKLCQIPVIPSYISTTCLGVFCISALIYGLLPGYPVWLTKGFQIAAMIIKFSTAAYLLISAVSSVLRKQTSQFLLFCTTGFGVTLLFDRIYSDFEPIYGGWLTEYGSAVMLMGLGMILWQDLAEAYRFQLTFATEKRQLTQQVAIQKAHYMELTDKIADTIKLRHDERHHLQILANLLDQKDYESLGNYLSEYVSMALPIERTVLCRNLIVDAMLRYYQNLCEQQGVSFSCEMKLPPDLAIPDVELSILFGNLLENAFFAASENDCPKAFISIKSDYDKGCMIILIENGYLTEPVKKGDHYLSSRHEGYGIGTQSVADVVEHYQGRCVFTANEGIFSVSIVVNL